MVNFLFPKELEGFALDTMANGLVEEAASCSGWLGLWRRAVGMVVIKEIRKVVLVALPPRMK